MHIVGTDAGNGIRLIPVHINQALETIFLTAVKLPINRALLINPAMVIVEVVQEVVPNDILRLTFTAQSTSNKFQVFVKRF